MPGRTGTPRHGDAGGLLVAMLAILAGLLAAASRDAPTGHPLTDALLTGAGVSIVVAVGSRAPWWAATAAAGVALAIALDPVLLAVAAAGLALALWAGATRRPDAWPLAASLGISLNVLARSELGGRFGTSAAIGLTVGFVVFAIGSWHLSRRLRWLSWAAVVVVVLAAGALSAGFAYAALKSRHDLASGLTAAELGVAALEGGDFDGAADWFAEAQLSLDQATARLGEPWAQTAAAVPIVAQHQHAVYDMSRSGAEALRTVSEALDEIDLDELRPEGGRFDLAALDALDAPLTRVRDALVGLRATSEASRSPWLAGRATYELDDFRASVDEHLPSIENALAAIRMAPEMLGVDEPRTYLLLFTTPSESRGLGGFVGSYAELTIDDGQLTLGQFGRSQDLDPAILAAGGVVHDHQEFLDQYGRFGYDADGTGTGVVGDSALRNLAMTPDFPTVATIASDLYAQTTGKQVDGVIAMDPFVVNQLLRYTGPVVIPSLGRAIGPDEALPFLLRDQYTTDVPDEQRADGLAEAAAQAFEGLIGGSLPDPIALARDLGPLTGDRRLLVWSAHPEEQEMIETVHIAGAIPPLDGADGWAFTVSNAGGNKIDTFLDRRAGYTSTTDAATGATTGTVRIELDNAAPAAGFPRYVIGNRIGQPDGTSTLWVTVYSPLGLDRLTVDGAEVGAEAGTEDGWNAYRVRVDIPPGETATIEATLSGTVADPTADIVTWEQPMERDVQPLS
jgi:hypothetical protein